MMRPLVLGLTAFASLTLGGCFGEAGLKEGAAAGAGIGALLGRGPDSDDPAPLNPEEGGEESPSYFGPVE